MSPYGPAEMGVRQMDTRPYGAGVREQIAEQDKRAAEMTEPPAKPKPQPGPAPTSAAPNPGRPMSWDLGAAFDQAKQNLADSGIGWAADALVNIPKRAWHAVEQIPDALKEYADAIKEDPLAFTSLNPHSAVAIGKAAMAVGAPLGAAFSPITDTARRAVVESDPVLRTMLADHIAKLPEDKRGDSMVKADTVNTVFDEAKDTLGRVANDPNQSPGDRLAAGIVSGLMQTQELAEFGAPSGIARAPRALTWLRATAPRVAEQAGLSVADLTARTAPGATSNLQRMVAEGADVTRVSKTEAAASEAANPSVVGKARAAAQPKQKVGGIPAKPLTQTPAQNVISVLNMPESRQTQNLGKAAQAAIEDNRRKAITQALRWGTIVDLSDTAAVRRYAARGGTVLTRIDDMIDTIQSEVARGMTAPQGFLDQLLDARASVSTQLSDIEKARQAGLTALADARKAESEASRVLDKAMRGESSTERAAGAAASRVLKTDIQARSATGAAAEQAGARVAGAEQKVQAKVGAEVAKEQTDADRLAALRVQAEQRVTELRQKADDLSLSAVDRESARMEAQRLSIAQRRAAILEGKQSSANRVSFAGEEMPEYGYLNADDQAIFDRTNIHIGKQESPLVGETIAQTLRQAEAAGQDIRKQHLSWDTIAGEMVRKFGEQDPDALINKVQKELRASPTKGEQAALYQAADKSITRLSEDARAAFARGSEEDGKRAAARLLQFIEDFRDAVGESARATASRRLVNKTVSADLIQGTSTLRASRARLADADKRLAALDKVTAEAATTSTKRLEAIDAANTKRDALVVQREAAIQQNVSAAEEGSRARATERVRGLQRQIDSVEELRARLQSEHDALSAKWEARVQEAIKEADAAKVAHDAAQQHVSEAARALQDTIIQKRAAQMSLTDEKMKVILQLDPENVAGFVRALRDQDIRKKGEILNTYVLANMFGGAGQLANAIGNIVSLAMNEGVYRPLSRVTAMTPGIRVRVGGKLAVTGGEVEASYAGAASSLMDATRFVVRTMARGEDVQTAAHRGLLEITTEGASALGVSGRPAVAGLKGLPIEWPRRLLTSLDGFTRIIATSGEASARTWREAGGGKAGAKAVAEFKTNPSIKQLEMANEYSGRVTYNEPSTPGSITALVVKIVNKEVGDTGLRPGVWVIPVVRFGLNAAAATVRLSGGGIVSGLRSASRAKEAVALGNDELALTLGRRAAMESAQGVVGVSMLAGGFLLLDQGLLTGSAPTDPKALATWKQQKKEEMSLNVMGHWVPLALLGPAAAPFLLAALLRDQSGAKDTDRLERMAMGLGKFASDIPAISGFYDLFGFADNVARNGFTNASEAYIARIVSRFEPYMSTGRALVPVFDTTVRDPEDLFQRLQANYPGLSTSVAPAIDPYTGDPLRRYSNPLGLSAVGQQAPEDVQSLIDAGHALVRPSNVLAGQKLTDAEWHSYQTLAGHERDVALEAVQQTSDYKNEKDPKVRQAMLDLADSRAMDRARLALARQLVLAAKTPKDTLRAFQVLMVEGGPLGARALALDDYRSRLTPDVTTALDAARMPNAQGDYPPSVADFQRAAPLIKQFLAVAPFRVGDETEWAQYVQARALRTQVAADLREANNGKDVDDRVLNAELRKKDPRAVELLTKYDDSRTANPARQRILDANPWLERFVSVYRFTQKR